MTNFQIEFTHPWLLLLLVPALFFALFPYFRLSKKYRKTRNRITSIVLHMLVMVLSISVLSGINFKYELPNTRNELILLVDGSFSGSETEEAKNNFVQAVLNECEPEMRVGIVTFGFNQVYAAPLTTDKSRAYRQYLEAEKPDGSATDIASALQYAGGIFENPQSGKIVLLTDGDETDRSASAVIRTIAASGITVDTVHFPAERNDSEVLITGVTLPDYNVVVEDSFKIGLTLQSSFVGAANVTLLDNGEPVGEPHAIELVSGTQTVEFEHVFHEQGLHALSFEISNDRDTLTQNNIFNSYIYLEVFDDLLIIERNADGSVNLLLEAQRTTDIIDKLYEFFYQSTGVYTESTAQATRLAELFATGNFLITPGLIGNAVSTLREFETDYSIIPYPKYDSNQEDYLTMVDGGHLIIGVPLTAKNPAETGIITEVMTAESWKNVIPAYYDVALKLKGTRDEESIAMLDKILDSVKVDFTYIYDNWQGFAFFMQDLLQAKNRDLMSYIEKNRSAKLTFYEQLYEAFDEMKNQ